MTILVRARESRRRLIGFVAVLAVGCGGGTTAPDPPRTDYTAPIIAAETADTIPPPTANRMVILSGHVTDSGVVTTLTVQRHASPCCDSPPVAIPITPGVTTQFRQSIALESADITLVLIAMDRAGNKATASIPTPPDQRAPLLVAIAPFFSAASSAIVSFYAFDDGGILQPRISTNGGPETVGVPVAGQSWLGSPEVPWFRFADTIRANITGDESMIAMTLTDRGGHRTTATTRVRHSSPVTHVAMGEAHWCAANVDGRLFCWGANDQGQLGRGTTSASEGIAAVPVPEPVRSVAGGYEHTCALGGSGAIYCWGGFEWDNQPGMPRPDPRVRSLVPVRLPFDVPLDSITAGSKHTCALAHDGRAFCWGLNGSGQLGDGTQTTRFTPVEVTGGHRFASLHAGAFHTCGLTANGTAYCWGHNYEGQLGVGPTVPWFSANPAAVIGGLRFQSIGTGSQHTCGATLSGTAYCWGLNDDAQLGNGGRGHYTVATPSPVLTSERFSSTSAGYTHSCAVSASQQALCWGDAYEGQLGTQLLPDPLATFAATPIGGAKGISFTALFSGTYSTCGTTAGGTLYCWGSSDLYGAPIDPGRTLLARYFAQLRALVAPRSRGSR